MNKYLESIQSMDAVGTGQEVSDSTVVVQISSEPPTTTYVKPSALDEHIAHESISYSAPQKVIVRTYRLRK